MGPASSCASPCRCLGGTRQGRPRTRVSWAQTPAPPLAGIVGREAPLCFQCHLPWGLPGDRGCPAPGSYAMGKRGWRSRGSPCFPMTSPGSREMPRGLARCVARCVPAAMPSPSGGLAAAGAQDRAARARRLRLRGVSTAAAARVSGAPCSGVTAAVPHGEGPGGPGLAGGPWDPHRVWPHCAASARPPVAGPAPAPSPPSPAQPCSQFPSCPQSPPRPPLQWPPCASGTPSCSVRLCAAPAAPPRASVSSCRG